MIAAGIGPQELVIVLVIVLIVFGGSSLPKLAKNLGKAQKEFKEGLADGAKSSESKASDAPSSDSSQS